MKNAFRFALRAFPLSGLFFCLPAQPGLPAPLPDFTLITPAGEPVTRALVSRDARWMLLYLRLDGPLPNPLLDTLNRRCDGKAPPDRLVIVLGGDPGMAQAFMAGYPGLARCRWYVDPRRDGWRLLELQSTPVFIGVDQRTRIWSFNGLSPTWLDQLEQWINEPPIPGARSTPPAVPDAPPPAFPAPSGAPASPDSPMPPRPEYPRPPPPASVTAAALP